MGKEKGPRHVAVAIVHAPASSRVLMISSRKHPDLWILPKGGVEHGESSGQAAVREAWEEAGTPRDLPTPSDADQLIELDMGAHPGSTRSETWHVHALRCAEQDLETRWMEEHERNRAWYSYEEALEKIRQWYRDPSGSQTLQDFKDGKGGKKDRKGGAMETALRAFIDKHGS